MEEKFNITRGGATDPVVPLYYMKKITREAFEWQTLFSNVVRLWRSQLSR